MKCPLHVGTEMRPVESPRPFVSIGGAAAATQRERAQRTILKCPVEGCPRVEAEQLDEFDDLDGFEEDDFE